MDSSDPEVLFFEKKTFAEMRLRHQTKVQHEDHQTDSWSQASRSDTIPSSRG